MSAKSNALEIIRFGKPERVVEGCPSHGVAYFGANHEGFDGGYFCGPDQGMPWPEAHRRAVSEAVAESVPGATFGRNDRPHLPLALIAGPFGLDDRCSITM